MSVRLFVILFNRSLRPRNEESHHKLDAWMQGEVFFPSSNLEISNLITTVNFK